MLFKHPFRWSATRVIQNHLLHAWKPDAYFPDKRYRKQALSSIPILSQATGNPKHLEEAKSWYLHLCAQQNLLLTYIEKGDPTRMCVVNSALSSIADHFWPDTKKREWSICAESADLLNLATFQVLASIAYAFVLAKKKFGDCDVKGNMTVSYNPETTIMNIDEYNIVHKLSDFYGDSWKNSMKGGIFA